MKAVMISIQPKWCELICSGKKTLEVRKTKPKLETPFKCYIYETKGKHGVGKVIGEFVCDEVFQYTTTSNKDGVTISDEDIQKLSCLTLKELSDYEFKSAKEEGMWLYGLYCWHISELKIYDKPQPLNWFVTEGDCNYMNCRKCTWFNPGNGYNVEDDCDLGYENIYRKKTLKPLFRAPQSWCYVEELD